MKKETMTVDGHHSYRYPIIQEAVNEVRAQRLNHYLASVRDAGEISADVAIRALSAWFTLRGAMLENLSVPDAAPGPEGQLLYAWNNVEHHLELEVFPNGPAEFFYLNRFSNDSWEDEFNVNTPVSQRVHDALSIFSATDD